MERLRAGEGLLSLLAPSAHLFWRPQRAAQAAAAASQRCGLRTGHRPLQCPAATRSFSASHNRRAEQPSATQTSQGARRASDAKRFDFDAALSNINADAAQRRAAAASTSPTGPSASGLPRGSTIEELLGSLSQPDSNTARRPAVQGSDVTRHLAGAPYQPPPLKPFDRRLGPPVGRTIAVNERNSIDATRAFRQLEIVCARNRVKQDFANQRFHERPGLKRKRLYMERWRKRFRREFDATVALVQKMRKQGW